MKTKIQIVVSGGVVQSVTSNMTNVEVHILDFDNMNDGCIRLSEDEEKRIAPYPEVDWIQDDSTEEFEPWWSDSDLGFFPVTYLSREDIQTRIDDGYIHELVDAQDLTDETMAIIADRMGESYVESGMYWDNLDDVTNIITQGKE